jgi:hypothetical protein
MYMPVFFLVGELNEQSVHGIYSGKALAEKKYSIEYLENTPYENYKSKIADLDEKNSGVFLGHASPDSFGGKTPKQFVDLLIQKGLNKGTERPIHLYLLGCQFSIRSVGKYGEEVMSILKTKGYKNIILHVFDPYLFQYKNEFGLMSNKWYETVLYTNNKSEWKYYGFPNEHAKNDYYFNVKKNHPEKNKKYLLIASNDPIQLLEASGKIIRVAPLSPSLPSSSLLFKEKKDGQSDEVSNEIIVQSKLDKI